MERKHMYQEIERVFAECLLDDEKSVLELHMNDLGYSMDKLDNHLFDTPHFKGMTKYWSEDSFRFLRQFINERTYPIERYKHWSEVTLEYMNDHYTIYSLLSPKAYKYYLAFYLWSYFKNPIALMDTSHYEVCWIMEIYGKFEKGRFASYNRQFIEVLSDEQMNLLCRCIEKMLDDDILSDFDKNELAVAYAGYKSVN